MTGRLCLLTCRTFCPEVRAALAAEGWDDVTAQPFPARCGRPPMTWQDLRPLIPADCSEVVLIGRSCLKGLAASRPADLSVRMVPLAQCFDLVAGQALVNQLLESGAYLITPGWLERWRGEIAEMGFDLAEAGPFFQDFARELVLLDTGSLPDASSELEPLAQALDLPVRPVFVGTDYLQARLGRLVAEWRMAEGHREARETAERQAAERADQASAMLMLQGLVGLRDEPAVLESIEEMVRCLFAPGGFHFLRWAEGGLAESELDQLLPGSLAAAARDLTGEWAWTPSGNGFLVRIGAAEAPLGVLMVEELAFPAFRDRYLNLALTLTGVFALALENARSYQAQLRTTADLVQARDAAEAASRAKSQFIANMSHELRTPLNAVIGFSEVLQWQEAVPQRREQLNAIGTAGKHLLSLIQDVLDLSRIEARKIEPRPTDFHLIAELEGIRCVYGQAAERKGLRFGLSLDPGLPPMVHGDAGLLRQILGNLIGNALKFTNAGRIDLKVRCDAAHDANPDAAGPLAIVFQVSDTGVGIRAENHSRIFETFEQEDNTHTRRFGGSGLGLAITRRLVTLLGGTIWLESEPGRGAHFSVRLAFPVVAWTDRAAAATAALEVAQTLDPVAPDPRTVLIVDDDPLTRSLLVQMLEQKRPYRPVAVGSGKSALELLGRERVDLILMDIQMPVMSGLDVTQRIRSGRVAGCNAGIPIIAVTAYAMEGDARRFLEQGATDYLSKPVRMDALIATVDRHLAAFPAQTASAWRQ